MKLILNFLRICGGGGQQNALSFLSILARDPEQVSRSVVVVRRDSPMHELAKKVGIETIAVAGKPLSMLLFELNCKRHFARGQVCFTFFGPPFLGSKGYLVNVAGCAYSNLFHPEIDFWSWVPWRKRVWLELKDAFRARSTVRADYWIFETPLLGRRAVELRGFPKERVGVVRMAASSLVSPENVNAERRAELERAMGPGFRMLHLSGAHPNKRQHVLPDVARELRAAGVTDFCFVTTMKEEVPYAQRVIRGFAEADLEQHLCNIGPVPSHDVPTLIDVCDSICCFAVLESFSNNFVESWRMGVPLVVTDGSWSRDACGEAALYVRPDDAATCAAQLTPLVRDAALREELVARGTAHLETYPTAEQKVQLYLKEIARAESLGFCPGVDRRKITWGRAASHGS